MENVQLVIPNKSSLCWQQFKTIIDLGVIENTQDSSLDKCSERPMLKVKEVCEVFHVSKPIVYDWLKQGKIKSVKIQSLGYFRSEDIDELIHQNQVEFLSSKRLDLPQNKSTDAL